MARISSRGAADASTALRAAALAGLIGLGLAVYFGLLRATGVAAPRELIRAIRRPLA